MNKNPRSRARSLDALWSWWIVIAVFAPMGAIVIAAMMARSKMNPTIALGGLPVLTLPVITGISFRLAAAIGEARQSRVPAGKPVNMGCVTLALVVGGALVYLGIYFGACMLVWSSGGSGF